MVVIWGIADGHSWLNKHPTIPARNDYPLLFDRDYKPKQAYFSLIEGREEL
jgi:endo-1,4-beta-xylanase